MRTKTLVCAAALLAAGVASSMAQSNVFSLNVVGYVNVPLTGGGSFNMIANPLNSTNNSIANLFSGASDGDQIFTWDSTAQDLGGVIYTYSAFSHTWDGSLVLAPGQGVFYSNAGSNRTNTFVGDVIQGSYTNPIPVVGSGSFNSFGSSIPLGGSFTNAIVGINVNDGDQIFTWNVGTQDLDGAIATYSAFSHTWDNTAIAVPTGIGFFYSDTGANQSPWVRNFTVQ